MFSQQISGTDKSLSPNYPVKIKWINLPFGGYSQNPPYPQNKQQKITS